ncbi:hypothetical protein FH692_05195 [Streptococcus suis]|uniref:Uncharacterized protein n=1 Tax=Streptococcus suis TaxID=1307 RepID=A0A540UXK9_STRSU|nr:hypothetical protein FH692_05195 [Streptococcus suis]
MIRSDLECKTRTNLPINHCAEMLTLTLRSGAGLFAQPLYLPPLTISQIVRASTKSKLKTLLCEN